LEYTAEDLLKGHREEWVNMVIPLYQMDGHIQGIKA
jgi:hypothetical protein